MDVNLAHSKDIFTQLLKYNWQCAISYKREYFICVDQISGFFFYSFVYKQMSVYSNNLHS